MARRGGVRHRRVVTVLGVLLTVVAVAGVGFGTARLSAASQASVRAVASPTAVVPGGRLVVLGAVASRLAEGSDQQVVEVSVRLVGTGSGEQFDPTGVLLRLDDGSTVPVGRGSLETVRLPASGAVEGRLGFVTGELGTPPVLVVPDGAGRTTSVQLLVVGAPRPVPGAERISWVAGA